MTIDNVLVITIDSLRIDTNIDGSEIFENRDDYLSFSQAYATGPGTGPSFPGILTGTLPLSYDGLGKLSDDRPRLAAELRSAGLETAGFHSNPFLSRHFNYDRGFDRFEDYQNPLMGVATRLFPRGIEMNNRYLRKIDGYANITNGIKKAYELVKGKPRPYVSAEMITDDTIEWLDTVEGAYFCWSHYMDVHHPCFPPKEYRERYDVGHIEQSDVSEWYSEFVSETNESSEEQVWTLKQLYKASIEYTRDQVGRIIQHLKKTDRFENTIVILTSDHGELFGEYGHYGKTTRMYDELINVPFVVANPPDSLESATGQLVSLLDIPPMVHDILGLNVPKEYRGIVPGGKDRREYIMAEHEVEGDVIVGARSENWLYEGDEIRDDFRLYDMRDGRFRRADSNHPKGATVREAVNERLSNLQVEARHLKSDLNDDVEERLKELGYK